MRVNRNIYILFFLAFVVMNKRGQAETEMIGELGKTVLYVMIFLLLVSVFYGTYSLFFKEKTSPQELDFQRIAREINALPEGRSMEVITSSEGYQVFLYGVNNDEARCAKKACLCIEQEGKTKKCELLEGVVACGDGLCAIETRYPASGVLEKGIPVPICRKNNNLRLGTC